MPCTSERGRRICLLLCCCCDIVVVDLLWWCQCSQGSGSADVDSSNTTGIPCGILLREIDIEWSLPLPDTTENTEAEKDGDEDDGDDDDDNNKEGEEEEQEEAAAQGYPRQTDQSHT